MRELNRADCAVLHLVLKKKWYDMIASGEKKEEYRDMKPYWDKRIESWLGEPPGKNVNVVVAFSKGYCKPSMWFEVAGISQPTSAWHWDIRSEWGEPDAPHYVLRLGERVVLK